MNRPGGPLQSTSQSTREGVLICYQPAIELDHGISYLHQAIALMGSHGVYLHRQSDKDYQRKLINWVRAGKDTGVRAA